MAGRPCYTGQENEKRIKSRTSLVIPGHDCCEIPAFLDDRLRAWEKPPCTAYSCSRCTERRLPQNSAPKSTIKVTLYPWDGVGGIDCVPVDIPPEKLELAFRLLTPEKYFEGGV